MTDESTQAELDAAEAEIEATHSTGAEEMEIDPADMPEGGIIDPGDDED